jgi:hypothetical protein
MERQTMVALSRAAMWLDERLPFVHGFVRRVVAR